MPAMRSSFVLGVLQLTLTWSTHGTAAAAPVCMPTFSAKTQQTLTQMTEGEAPISMSSTGGNFYYDAQGQRSVQIVRGVWLTTNATGGPVSVSMTFQSYDIVVDGTRGQYQLMNNGLTASCKLDSAKDWAALCVPNVAPVEGRLGLEPSVTTSIYAIPPILVKGQQISYTVTAADNMPALLSFADMNNGGDKKSIGASMMVFGSPVQGIPDPSVFTLPRECRGLSQTGGKFADPQLERLSRAFVPLRAMMSV